MDKSNLALKGWPGQLLFSKVSLTTPANYDTARRGPYPTKVVGAFFTSLDTLPS